LAIFITVANKDFNLILMAQKRTFALYKPVEMTLYSASVNWHLLNVAGPNPTVRHNETEYLRPFENSILLGCIIDLGRIGNLRAALFATWYLPGSMHIVCHRVPEIAPVFSYWS